MARTRVRIYAEAVGYVDAELFDDLSPNTFKKVTEVLPVEGIGYRWGDEVYFSTDIEAEEENPREVVEKGTIAYWPPGKAICIFWGPTPASRTKDEIRPASPVNIIGRILGDPGVFSKFRDGGIVRIEKTQP